MGPAELLDYDRQRLRGLVLEEGGAASHVAIVARALGIAAHDARSRACSTSVEPGDAAIVDAEGGELHVRPTQEVGVGLFRQGPLPGAASGAIRRLAHRAVGDARRRAGVA